MAQRIKPKTYKISYELKTDDKTKLPLFKLEMRDLAVGETSSALDKASSYYQNFSDIGMLIDSSSSNKEDLEEIESLLKMTKEEDSEYKEILLEKIRLKRENKELSKKLLDAIVESKRDHNFVSLTNEYGKVAKEKLKIMLEVDDGLLDQIDKLNDLERYTLIYLELKEELAKKKKK